MGKRENKGFKKGNKQNSEKTKKFKENSHRTKLRKERENRLRGKHQQKEKKKLNNELYDLIKAENLDQLDVKAKKKVIKELNNLIISFPNENYDKIDLLLSFLQDGNVKILMKTMKLVKNLFVDIMPSYKIRVDEEGKDEKSNQKGKNLSKEVENVQSYERAILKYYEKFLNILSIFLKTFSSSTKSASKESIAKLIQYIIETICQLFEKFYLFNSAGTLYKIIVEKLTDSNKIVRQKCQETLIKVLSTPDNSNNMLDLKYSIIKLISHIIFIKPHERFEPNVLDLFSCHKIEFPDLQKGKEEIKKLNDIKLGPRQEMTDLSNTDGKFKTKKEMQIEGKKKKFLMKEKEKILKSLRREMGEYENYRNDKAIFNMNLKILKKILLVFFDILKNKKDSPLIRSVLSGIGILCDNINVEILVDLQKCIYEYVRYIVENQEGDERKIFGITALKSCLNITEKLTKDIISLEDSNLINMTYLFLSKIPDNGVAKKMTQDDLFPLLEILDNLLLKNRQYSMDVVSAYVKRLAIFTNNLNPAYIPSFLLLIKRILQKYPSLSTMRENDEDQFDYSFTADPSLCNGRQSNISKELKQISDNFSHSKTVKKLLEYIAKDDKNNPQLASLSYYDVLLS